MALPDDKWAERVVCEEKHKQVALDIDEMKKFKDHVVSAQDGIISKLRVELEGKIGKVDAKVSWAIGFLLTVAIGFISAVIANHIKG